MPPADQPRHRAKRFFSVAVRADLFAIAKLAVPLALSHLAQIAVGAIALMFIGRLGAQELAGASLAVGLFNCAPSLRSRSHECDQPNHCAQHWAPSQPGDDIENNQPRRDHRRNLRSDRAVYGVEYK